MVNFQKKCQKIKWKKAVFINGKVSFMKVKKIIEQQQKIPTVSSLGEI